MDLCIASSNPAFIGIGSWLGCSSSVLHPLPRLQPSELHIKLVRDFNIASFDLDVEALSSLPRGMALFMRETMATTPVSSLATRGVEDHIAI